MKSTFKCFFRRCLSTDQRPERTSASAPADLHVLHISLCYLIISSLMKYVIFQQELTATDLIPKPRTPFFIMRPAHSSALGKKATSAAFQSPSYLLTTTRTKGKQKLTTDRQKSKTREHRLGKCRGRGEDGYNLFREASIFQKMRQYCCFPSDDGRSVLCVHWKVSVRDFWQLLSFHKGQYEAGTVKITTLDVIPSSTWSSDSLILVIADACAGQGSTFSNGETVTETHTSLALMLRLSWFKSTSFPTTSEPILETCKRFPCREAAASWSQENQQDTTARIILNKATEEFHFILISLQSMCLLIQLPAGDGLNYHHTALHFFQWHIHNTFHGTKCCLQHMMVVP